MFFYLLYLVPKNWLSYAFGVLTRKHLPFDLNKIIRDFFVRAYHLDMSDAEFPQDHYATLSDLFIRQLKSGARPIAKNTLVSPVDGTLTQMGKLVGETPKLTQIKGKDYTLKGLIGKQIDAEPYLNGFYQTIYLAPYNYHRIHAPIGGRITQVTYLPGALWPVNTWSVQHIDGLFTVNERIIVELENAGEKILVIMVGATNVGRITLDFLPTLHANKWGKRSEIIWIPEQPLYLEKGQGLGCFELGSTVILIGTSHLIGNFNVSLADGPVKLRMGQGLAD